MAAATDHDERGVLGGRGVNEPMGCLAGDDVERPFEGPVGEEVEGVFAARRLEFGERPLEDPSAPRAPRRP